MTMKVRAAAGLGVASAAALSLLALGCDKDSAPPPRSTLLSADAATIQTKAPPPPLGTKAVFYKFGPANSKIEFVGAKVTGKHEGSFRTFEGTIGLVANDPTMSAAQVTIDLASLTVEPAKLAAHLKGKDFFDVEQFPKANYTTTTIRPGASPTSFNVTGKLNLHGVIKPLTFPATIKVSEGGIDAEGEIALNRKDFGIVYPGMPDDLIADNVAIKLSIHAKPAESAPAASAASAAPARSAN
jgi:polyisoprenoid-binding protein YceI